MIDEGDPPYAIGYKRPPQANRFRPGQSGNPRGRPKGSKNLATAIQAELDTLVAITENGRRWKISKRDAIAKQMVNKAASGDARAMLTLLNELRQHENNGTVRANPFDSPEDALVMENIIRRIRRSEDVPTAPEHPPGLAAAGESSPPTGGDRR